MTGLIRLSATADTGGVRYYSAVRDLSAEGADDAASPDAGREVNELAADQSDDVQRCGAEWADLLRHKAAALRAVRDAGLQPGSLDPAALAAVLAGPPPPRVGATRLKAPEEVLRHAQQVWDSVADTGDPGAVDALAAECESVAAELDALSR